MNTTTIDLKGLQRQNHQQIEKMAAELEGRSQHRDTEFEQQFISSGKTQAGKAGWERRFIASGKTVAPRP